MTPEQKGWIVISLGGSLVVPDAIDTDFLTRLITLITKHVEEGYRFVLIVGGGKTCRRYQAAAAVIRPESTNDELDWIGIYATRLNAMLVRTALGTLADPYIVTDPGEFPQTEKSIVVGAGWKPGSGWSTDYVAVTLAHNIGAPTVINLSNIDRVYDSDPHSNPDAKAFSSISWEEYRSYIPKEWSPGLNTPFDPTASQKAQEYGIEVAIMNVNNLENLDDYLAGKPFEGTRITV